MSVLWFSDGGCFVGVPSRELLSGGVFVCDSQSGHGESMLAQLLMIRRLKLTTVSTPV